MNTHKVDICGIWQDPTYGLQGGVGVVLMDGTQVHLCSMEKLSMSRSKSVQALYKRIKKYPDKLVATARETLWCDVSEDELRRDGLGKLSTSLSDCEMRSDRSGETETGRFVAAGTRVTYLGHLPGCAIKVRIGEDVEVMNPGCFKETR